jgi:hypothetical protein
MENPRTNTARETDDHEMIDAAVADGTPESSASGGDLARDVASKAELESVADPDGTRGVEKDDTIADGEARPSASARG